MKSVLLSIKPKYCKLIANGKKTIEIRKNRPKLETPFKCYIYCTKVKERFQYDHIIEYLDELYRLPNGEIKYGWSGELMCYEGYGKDNFLNGKIIGEFICNKIVEICYGIEEGVYFDGEWQDGFPSNGKGNNPTCLSFIELEQYLKDEEGYGWHISNLKIYDKPKELSELHIQRPPQSWCYVNERETK